MNAIVEATTRVLSREGYQAASTRRVAKEAGVSVGSLYQYFPSRESLVAEVANRLEGKWIDSLGAVLARLEGASLEDLTRAVVRHALQMQQQDPRLHRELTCHGPEIGVVACDSEFEADVVALFQGFFADRVDLGGLDVDRVVRVLLRSFRALIRAAAAEGTLADPQLEQDLVRLTLGYLGAGG